MELKPDRVHGIDRRTTDEVAVAPVDPRDPIAEPPDIMRIARDRGNEFAQSLDLSLDDLDDLRLRLGVAVTLLPVTDRFDELVIQRLRTARTRR